MSQERLEMFIAVCGVEEVNVVSDIMKLLEIVPNVRNVWVWSVVRDRPRF